MSGNVNPAVAEYNAFGPWVYEITDKHPLPPLFYQYFTIDDDAIMKLKIPREIERRNAEPGMDLYDYVIALYEDSLLVLERQGESVKKHEIALKDFMGIRIYENLLKGGYTVFSAEEAVSFPFNAISVDLFQKLTNLVLEKMHNQSRDVSSLPVTDTVPEAMLLRNMLHDIQMATPDIRVGAVQKSADVHRKGATRDMIERLLWKETNPEALHLYTDKYLIIVENGLFPNQVGMQDFGYTQTIIPFSRISGVEFADSQEYSLLKECIISMGENKVTYHFEEENEEMTAFYNALK